jgi:hypothetical protein
MTLETLGTPVVTGAAVRSVNFFNGRLLTGEDLRAEQAAVEARLARLGRAAGDGVVDGLEVSHATGSSTAAKPVVTVEAGLAIAPNGQTLELTTAVDVSLARPGPVPGAEPGGLFADCQPYAPGTYTAGAGVYLLAIGPARQGEGRAPVSGLGNEPAPCNTAVSVEAVRFRLIRLALPPAELLDRARLRNRVAYRCFGPADAARDPFGAPPEPTLVERLRTQTLAADEVPLATIGWDMASGGIHFVDLWSVRRRPAAADPESAAGEARLQQFQAQIEERARAGHPETVGATSLFTRLPPVGMLPLAASAAGFDVPNFFAGLKTRGPFHIPGARLRGLIRASLPMPPVDPQSPELVWLYLTRENRDPSVAGGAAERPYVVFATGFLPYQGQPQFDLSRWDFANYALHVS